MSLYIASSPIVNPPICPKLISASLIIALLTVIAVAVKPLLSNVIDL